MALKDSTLRTTGVSGEPRPKSSWPLVLLIVGDAIVFLVFAAIGRKSHGEASGLDALAQIVLTALPFAIGWFVVAPVIGAFRQRVIRRPGSMALRTLGSWIGGCAVGMVLRGIFVDHAVPPPSFMAVALISNSIFLLIWRLPFAWIYGRKQQS